MDAIDAELVRTRRLLGAAIRRSRNSCGLSQRSLANLAGLNQSTICRLERGTIGGLRYATLLRILHALGLREMTIVGTPWFYRVG